MARRRGCKICGDDTGDPGFDRCSRCAQIGRPIAPRPAPAPRREPGSDDEPTAPARPVTEADRQRWHEQRIAHVREAFERGRRALLARCLDPENSAWSCIQH